MIRRLPFAALLKPTWHLLSSPLGQWRTQLVWRLFGLVCFLSIYILLGPAPAAAQRLAAFPLGHHCLLVGGLLLFLSGPRLLLLLLIQAATLLALVPIVRGTVYTMVADEYILLMILPFMGIVLTLMCAWRALYRQDRPKPLDFRHSPTWSDDVDCAQVYLFRVSAILASSFAAFHKLNEDFLNPAVSCALVLARDLERLWNNVELSTLGYTWKFPFPDFLTNPTPVQVIVGEALVPILLLIYPRIGILYTLCAMGVIGHIGPVPFTLSVITMACAFFHHRDGATIRAGLERHWHWLLTAILLVSGYSFETFLGGRYPWFQFHVLQVVLICLAFGVLHVLASQARADLERLRSTSSHPATVLKDLVLPCLGRDTRLPAMTLIRITLVVYVAVGALNGLSPYFGLKYRFSFAMLSNLRVDHLRWNSLLIPKGFYLRRYDHHLYVSDVRVDPADREKLAQRRSAVIHLGPISPSSFKKRLEHYRRLKIKFDVHLNYQGRSHLFKDAGHNEQLWAFVAALPGHRLFQHGLTPHGPQHCVH